MIQSGREHNYDREFSTYSSMITYSVDIFDSLLKMNHHSVTYYSTCLYLLFVSGSHAKSTINQASTEQSLRCSSLAFTDLMATKNVTILDVHLHPANVSYHAPYNLVYKIVLSNLPSFCSVYGNVSTSETSSFIFLVWLPESNWNHRFLMVGNGGFAGALNYRDCGAGIRRGFACATTNTGHNSTMFDGSWAYRNSETVIDWGYRAMHQTVILAKQIVQLYYTPSSLFKSYFQGCSTGGRQGLKEIQEFPDDFDGILIGAPAWWNTHLQPWSVKVATFILPTDSANHISPTLFPAIHAEVMKQCDGQDGLLDQIISEPFGCDFNWNSLLCSATSKRTSQCLKSEQLDALYKLYHDYVETNNTYIFSHMPFGSELQWNALLGQNEPSPLGLDFVRYFILNDPNWNYTSFDYSIIEKADRLRPGNANADNFNLRPFFIRGGKVIHYHGLADGLIPPGSSQYFYDHVYRNHTELNLDDYYRFFHVPGLQHCASTSTNAPWVIGGAGQDAFLGDPWSGVPYFNDSQHDALLALIDWVENGIVPEKIIATRYTHDDPSQGVSRQRPICPYPKKALYLGCGSIDDPNNFYCST